MQETPAARPGCCGSPPLLASFAAPAVEAPALVCGCVRVCRCAPCLLSLLRSAAFTPPKAVARCLVQAWRGILPLARRFPLAGAAALRWLGASCVCLCSVALLPSQSFYRRREAAEAAYLPAKRGCNGTRLIKERAKRLPCALRVRTAAPMVESRRLNELRYALPLQSRLQSCACALPCAWSRQPALL
jgi:hypothetical protein